MIRTAIVGCGKIADQHVAAIGRIPDSRVVALCDREVLMARQLGERCQTNACFGDLGEMLDKIRPDVVHITTPPQGHFPLAKQCLESGSHVYLEKPFTVTAPEADQLVDLAERSDLKITAGHNLQFTLEMLAMRRLVRQGFLGGKPVHLESHFSYSLDDTGYVGPVLGSRNHWVRRLPGQLLHNILSHGIAKLAEFLDDDITEVVARAHQSPRLKSLGGQEVLDELRVMIQDASGTTAYFCFTTQVKPGLNRLRICGPAATLEVDHTSGCLMRYPSKSHKSYLTYFAPPLLQAKAHLGNACRNIVQFLKRRLHQDFGMKELIDQFYQSIENRGGPPIPYREIRLTARLMDEIFAQIYDSRDEKPIRVELG